MVGRVISVRLGYGITLVSSDATTIRDSIKVTKKKTHFSTFILIWISPQAIQTTLEKYFSGGVYLHLAIQARRILWAGTLILCGGRESSLHYLQCKYCSICSPRVYLMQRERISSDITTSVLSVTQSIATIPRS